MNLLARTAIGATALTFALGGGLFAPASAATSASDVSPAGAAQCKGKKVCFWYNKDFKGSFSYVVKGNKPKCWQFDAGSNKASSFRVMTGVRVRLYDGDRCTGAKSGIFKAGKYAKMGRWDNKVSSVKVY